MRPACTACGGGRARAGRRSLGRAAAAGGWPPTPVGGGQHHGMAGGAAAVTVQALLSRWVHPFRLCDTAPGPPVWSGGAGGDCGAGEAPARHTPPR
ncbi:hypothetical protein BU14_0231s0004 [Porphyra umbilicalis]|uniref:Uncharacterized protein n=1 Tax=Porphyra umbilicalis TaxID=2786 RepID=A0A1X6P3U2_PORUM|nr:hypothetical protein BU14_0231s0004 [Porphyra umbilicalis]|eukprot:OSX75551.1 hypothetical protein BU14_0231s0004 [Porphyra umbilicalis]